MASMVTVVKSELPWNADCPMLVMLAGKLSVTNLLLLKAKCPIVLNVEGNSMLVNAFVVNALSPILVSAGGNVTDASLEQYLN